MQGGGEWTDTTPAVRQLVRFLGTGSHRHLLASFPISRSPFLSLCFIFSLATSLSLSLQKKEASVFPLQSGAPTQITARENTYMDKVRTERGCKPATLPPPPPSTLLPAPCSLLPCCFSSPGSSQSGWPPLALVDGSCCSCPYLVWRRSSALRPWRSRRNIPATIDLDGTQDSHPRAYQHFSSTHNVSFSLLTPETRSVFFLSLELKSLVERKRIYCDLYTSSIQLRISLEAYPKNMKRNTQGGFNKL